MHPRATVKILLGILLGYSGSCLVRLPVWATSAGFAEVLMRSVADGVLDKIELKQLKTYTRNTLLSSEDQQLAKHFFGFIGKHREFVKISYGFYKQAQTTPVRLQFLFAPNYTEDEQIPGDSWSEVLANISQRDTLKETTSDSFRCGAAALLSSHFLLAQNFSHAFQRLNLPLALARPTYREVHLAQDLLYRQANTDGQPGLISAVRYAIHADGSIGEAISEGEIQTGADVLGLKLAPLLGPTKEHLYQRKAVVLNFWRQNPQGILLVGVYLDEQTGVIQPPRAGREQNHFVLIFRQDNSYYLINSGVSDNGGKQALKPLNQSDLKRFVFDTTGTLQGATLKKE